MGSIQEPTFTGLPEMITADALLFDFDGTIIDSTAAIVKHWHNAKARIIADNSVAAEAIVPAAISKLGNEMGVDPDIILATSHGRRSIDVLRLYDPSRANWEYVSAAEGRIPKEFGSDAVEIPGARKLLRALDDQNVPWAVVTSGTRPLITGWLDVLKLVAPKTLVAAEDVENGKPDPACYLLGRQRLGLEGTTNIIVVEDAPSGIRAGKAAGFKVIGLATTHSLDQIREAGADWIIRDLTSLVVKDTQNSQVRLEIKDTLEV